jgi:hypothetical protein
MTKCNSKGIQLGNLPQLGPSGRKETAQQPTVTELLQAALPALGTAAEPLEYPGQPRGDRSLALAKVSPGVRARRDLGAGGRMRQQNWLHS